MGSPGGSDGEESTGNADDLGLTPGSERCPREGNGCPAHSSILALKIPWQRSLAGYSPWGHKESNMIEQLTHACMHIILPM